MRKLLVMTLIAEICFPIYAKYSGGTGEPNDPYLIESPDDLNSIGLNPNDWSKHFKMIADVNLCDFTGTELNLIGHFEEGGNIYFSGVFDGNGHAISNFTYNSPNEGYIGIFKLISGPHAVIKDLGIINPNISTHDDGWPSSGISVGPLAGFVGSGATIERCFSKGGSVSGSCYVGGLIGVVGAGYLDPVGYTKVRDCYAANSISGNQAFGGLLGRSVTKSLHAIHVERCYAAGQVGEGGYGLVGEHYHGEFYDCFWDIEATEQSDSGVFSGGVIGKTTAEMQIKSTFTSANWNIVNVWDMGENQTYPFLRKYLPSDINKDGETNLYDFAIVVENWLKP